MPIIKQTWLENNPITVEGLNTIEKNLLILQDEKQPLITPNCPLAPEHGGTGVANDNELHTFKIKSNDSKILRIENQFTNLVCIQLFSINERHQGNGILTPVDSNSYTLKISENQAFIEIEVENKNYDYQIMLFGRKKK